MEKYYPYNSVGGDRTHDADDLARLIKAMLTNGVQMKDETALQVKAGGNLTAKVLPGTCIVEGRIGIAEVEQIFEIPAPSAALDRLDLVVARADYIERKTRLVYVQGEPHTAPVLPGLKNGEYGFDIPLAQIEVTHGATDITQANITDLREMCAFVVPANLTAFFEQVWTKFREIRDTQAKEYYEWLSEMTATLDENAAGHIMNLLNEYRMKTFAVEVLASGWKAVIDPASYIVYQNKVAVPGVKADMIPNADLILSDGRGVADEELNAWAMVAKIEMGDDFIILTCLHQQPTKTFNIRLKVVK